MTTVPTRSMDELKYKAAVFRERIAEMYIASGHGHYGGSFSSIEIMTALYLGGILRVDSANVQKADRDRFILSKGHAAGTLVTVLADIGILSVDEVMSTFNKMLSHYGSHPDMNKIRGVEMSTGSLGHGLPVGVGMALAAKDNRQSYRIFVLMGDGELDEGSVWEAAMSAAHFGLDNMVGIVDRNRNCIDGSTESVMALEPLADKWKAFGWSVRCADGHDFESLLSTLQAVPFEKGRPSVVIADTVKGKGVSFMEGKNTWHSGSPTREQIEQIRAELHAAKEKLGSARS